MDSTRETAVAVVTGASQGIGKAVFMALTRSGQPAVGVSRTKPAEFDSADNSFAVWKSLDLSKPDAVVQFAAALGPGPIRALILSAVDYGWSGRRPASEIDAEEWQRVIATNCIGHCILVSALLPNLVKQSPGIIVHISSDVVLVPAAGRAAYASSKAGLHAMLRAVSAEEASEHLHVYQLIPTFQLATEGLRRRRPADFDFSSYGEPDSMAQVVEEIVLPGTKLIPPGSYLVNRDGSLDQYPETQEIKR